MSKDRFVNVMSKQYKEWLKGLHKEDVILTGSVVYRPQSALNLLYNIYRKHNDL